MSGDAPGRASSESDARQLDAGTVSPASNRTDVFDDQFATEDADSRRVPSIRTDNPFQSTSDTDSASSVRSHNSPPFNRLSDDQANRNSTTKTSNEDDDEEYAPSSSNAGPAPHRSLSSASTTSYAPPLSPASASAGPSHPYSMYPQNLGMSRSASVATSSTVRASQSRQGPSHPYGLYPQNVSSEMSEMPTQGIIPLGFPGHGQDYHRRIGADGEEQGIVGADGHLEQLPPYSRYPDEYHTKIAGSTGLASIGESNEPRQAEMQQRTSPLSETPTPTNDSAAAESPSSAAPVYQQRPASEKAWSEKTWNEKKHTKFWGWLPFWALVFVVLVLLISGIVCGAAIGAVVSSKNAVEKKLQQAQNHTATATTLVTTTTRYIDATPVAEPSGPVKYPDGNYWAEFYASGSPECLGNVNEDAWSCALPDSGKMQVDVDSSNAQPLISIYPMSNDICYGSQPPRIVNQSLAWVKDVNNLDFGYACHFQTFYNKLVVVQTHKLYPPSRKRWFQRSVPKIQDDSTAWFCWWNSTFIEGFVYMDPPNDIQPSELPTPTNAPWYTPSSYSIISSYSSSLPSPTPTIKNDIPTPSAGFPKILKIEERRLQGQPGQGTCYMMRRKGGVGPFEQVFDHNGDLVEFTLQERDPPAASVHISSRQPSPTQRLAARRDSPMAEISQVPLKGCWCQWIADNKD